MPISTSNATTMKKFNTLVGDSYSEPVNGVFPDATNEILAHLKSDSDNEELNAEYSSSGEE